MLKEKISAAVKKISFKNFREQRLAKYSNFFAVFLILIIIGLVVPFGFAHAAGIETVIGGILMSVLYGIIYVIFYVLFEVAFLISWIGAYVVSISLNPAIMNQVFANPAIYTSWKLIRDVCNLLFLLIMLFIAFGTIIQHSKYNIKNNLLKLIIAIFLINFSNVVAGVIIDFGNIIMFGVLKWMCPVTSNTCFQDSFSSLMAVVDNFRAEYSLLNVGLDLITPEAAVGIAIATIYTFIYGFILLALALFLIVRTAGLAILLILSPFAYFGGVMPGMEKVGQRWWNKIWSYALFGPIFVLMLYISSEIAKTTITAPPVSNPDLAVWGTLIATIITNVIPLLFLLSIISITRELGLLGTSVILNNTTGVGEKIGVGAAKYVGTAADRFAARGARPGMPGYRRALSLLSPGAWKRAARNMKAEQEHDFDIAAGSHWNKLERLPGGNRNVDREQVAVDREVARVMSTLSDNVGQLVDTNKKAVAGNNPIVIEASIRKVAQTGDTNKVLRELGFSETREGFSDYLQSVKDVVGDRRTQLLAYEVAQSEDKDGNSGYIGFSHEFEDDSPRLLDLSDKYYRSKKDGSLFKNPDGSEANEEQTQKHIAELKEMDAKKVDGREDHYSNWAKEYKTDKQYQQEAVNHKLTNKSAYSRNSKLKALSLREQDVATDNEGNVIIDERTGKPKVITGKFHTGDQGEEYYNTVGKGNERDMRFLIKKEGEKQRDDLYNLARNRKVTKWSKKALDADDKETDGKYGLTKEEKAYLQRLEDVVGPAEGRDKGPMKSRVKKRNPDGTFVKDEEGNDVWEDGDKYVIKKYEKTKEEPRSRSNKDDESEVITDDATGERIPSADDEYEEEPEDDDSVSSTGSPKNPPPSPGGAANAGPASQQEANAGIDKAKPTPEEQKVLDSIRQRAAGRNKTRTILPITDTAHWSEKEASKASEAAKASQAAETKIEKKKKEIKEKKKDLAQEIKKAKEGEMISVEEADARISDALAQAKEKNHNPAVTNYVSGHSEGLQDVAKKLEEQKADKETIEAFKKAAAMSLGMTANNLERNVAQAHGAIYYPSGSAAKKVYKKADIEQVAAGIQLGSYKIDSYTPRFEKIGKDISGMKGSEGIMFNDQLANAKKLHGIAKNADFKTQQVLLAVTEKTLQEIENNLPDEGSKK